MAVAEAIFDRDGEAFVPTEAALSPWSDQRLHGGPPTMLMVREIERFPADQEMFVTRITVELLRPVGRTPLTLTCRLVRPGRKVQLVESSLWNGEVEVARATALRIRTAAIEVPRGQDRPPHPAPDELDGLPGRWRPGDDAFHIQGVEIRSAKPEDGGPVGWAWFRLKLPVVKGEAPSPVQRICAAADFPNGISYVVDPRETTFLNPDLTVYIQRLPAGEWVLVDARTWLEPHGTGLTEGALYDQTGRLGRSLQSLIVERRS